MNLFSLLNRFFKYQIRLVCCFPLFFLALPVFISATLFAVAWHTGNLNSGKQSLNIFLPDSMQSLKELKDLLRLFPPQNALRDSYSLFGSSFAYAIFEDKSIEDGNVLEAEKLKQIAQIHKMIMQNIKTKNGLNFADICFRDGENSTCTQHPIMVALEDSQANLAIKLLARYPTLRLSGGIVVDNAIIFGGVKLSPGRVDRHGNAAIERAKAIRLFYVLNQSKEADEWIREFIQKMVKIRPNSLDLFYTSSISLPDEMERNGELLLPWMPWMVGMLFAFCAIICLKFDPIRAQPLIGLAAMLNAFMAIISAISVLISIEYPFMQMILIMPFLILSIGVDNMFLMLRNWRTFHNSTGKGNSNLEGIFSLDAIFVEAISEVSVSIFVTSLTDGVSFAIGTLSDFMAVRVFCTYCWLAVLFMFLYQMTFLTAFMALNCRREAMNRHWLFCCIQMSVRHNSSRKQWEISNEIYKYAAHIIEHKFTKLATLLFYFIYLYFSAHWISKLQLGLDLKLLMPDDSFVAEELRVQERLFADYGPFGYCVIFMDNNNKSGINLWERHKRRKLLEFYAKLTSGKYASKGDFWLEAFHGFSHSKKLHFDGEEEFTNALVAFLQDSQFAKYQTDIRLNENGQIEAIKMAFRMRKLGHANDQPRAQFLRSVMAESGFKGFVYDTTFLLVDQQEVTRRNMIANILVAIGVMLLISIIFVPRPMASLSVALTILSINVGVVGALSAVKTRLDIVSMITIVMSIGLSFDYATHVTFQFLLYKKHRIENTLRALAIPICQAALSTLVGVSVLAIVPSYMIRTFVFTVLFVVSIGLAHALFFMPVLLDFVVPEREYLSSTNDSSTLSIRTLRELAIRSTGRQSTTTNSQTNSIVYFY